MSKTQELELAIAEIIVRCVAENQHAINLDRIREAARLAAIEASGAHYPAQIDQIGSGAADAARRTWVHPEPWEEPT